MVAVHLLTTLAHKETAKQAILKQLREAGSTSSHMAGSLNIDSDDAQSALAELLADGKVKQARAGLYYLGEAEAKEARPGSGLIALLAMLIVISFTASLVAIAVTQG